MYEGGGWGGRIYMVCDLSVGLGGWAGLYFILGTHYIAKLQGSPTLFHLIIKQPGNAIEWVL